MKLQNLYFSILKAAGIVGALALVLCFSAFDASAQPGSGRITPTTGASKKKTTTTKTTTVKKNTTVAKKTVTRTTKKVTTGSKTKNYDYYYNLGLAFYNKGDLRNAILNYNQAIQLNPRSADAFYNRGLAYYDNEQYPLSIADYSASIRINAAADAYNNRGLAYEKNGNRAQAIADYKMALRINPSYEIAQDNLARLEDNDDDDDSGSAGSAGGSGGGGGGNTSNNNSDYYAELADEYYDKRDFDNALINYTRAINLAPREAGSYVRRGFIYHYTGDVPRAYDDYNTAVRLDSSLKSEAYIQCMLYDVTNDSANSGVNICTKTITEFPAFSLAYYKRGVAYRALKNYDMAIRDFSKSIELYPKFFNSNIYLGLIYSEQNKNTAAINEYTKAIQVAGANNRNVYLAYNNRGVVYEEQGNLSLAAADYQKSYQLNPNFTTAKENYDAVQKKRGY